MPIDTGVGSAIAPVGFNVAVAGRDVAAAGVATIDGSRPDVALVEPVVERLPALAAVVRHGNATAGRLVHPLWEVRMCHQHVDIVVAAPSRAAPGRSAIAGDDHPADLDAGQQPEWVGRMRQDRADVANPDARLGGPRPPALDARGGRAGRRIGDIVTLGRDESVERSQPVPRLAVVVATIEVAGRAPGVDRGEAIDDPRSGNGDRHHPPGRQTGRERPPRRSGVAAQQRSRAIRPSHNAPRIARIDGDELRAATL
ncbi:MAG TPA: hypothetical protein PKA95_02805 [Thermomicrobiales bacterium]|nr:hypothetical protein [Thermomicrobiales bacterium]